MRGVPETATGILSVLTTLLCGYSLSSHWRQSRHRAEVWLFAHIAALPLVVTWLSWAGSWEHSPLEVFDLLQRLWKAICVVAYLKFAKRLIGWKPGSNPEYCPELVESSLMKVEYVRHLPPCCCLQPLPLRNSEELLTHSSRSDIGVLQFVVLCPSVMVTGLLLRYAGREDLLRMGETSASAGWLYVTLVSSLSATVAAYFVALQSRAESSAPETDLLQIPEKALWIVCVALGTEVQKLAIGLLAKTTLLGNSAESREVAVEFTNIICCCEMLAAAATMKEVFPVRDFQPRGNG